MAMTKAQDISRYHLEAGKKSHACAVQYIHHASAKPLHVQTCGSRLVVIYVIKYLGR